MTNWNGGIIFLPVTDPWGGILSVYVTGHHPEFNRTDLVERQRIAIDELQESGGEEGVGFAVD